MVTKVSFIITNYNYAEFVEQAITSCLNQNVDGFTSEVILVDDGSTDASADIIKKFKGDISILHTLNVGVERAFNTGYAKSSGDYIVRVDADDFLSANFLGKVSPYLQTSIDILYGNYTEVNSQGVYGKKVYLPKFNANEIVGRGDFLATGTVVRSFLFSEFSMYQNKIKNCGLENYEFILTCLLAHKQFKQLQDNLFYYRIHKKNMSGIRKDQIFSYGENLLERLVKKEYQIGAYHPYFGEKS